LTARVQTTGGVQRLPARAGLGGDVGRELDRALVRLDVDHLPAPHEIAGLWQRAVGGDRRRVRAAVAHPGARRRERLRVDVFAHVGVTTMRTMPS